MKSVHLLAYSWDKAKKSRNYLGLWPTSCNLPSTHTGPHQTTTPDPLARTLLSRVKACHCQGGLSDLTLTLNVEKQPLLVPAGSADWERSGALAGVPGPECRTQPGPHQAPVPATLAELLFPSGVNVLFPGWGRVHTLKEQEQIGPNLRASTLEHCNTVYPSIGQCWSLSIREAPIHNWLMTQHLHLQPHLSPRK